MVLMQASAISPFQIVPRPSLSRSPPSVIRTSPATKRHALRDLSRHLNERHVFQIQMSVLNVGDSQIGPFDKRTVVCFAESQAGLNSQHIRLRLHQLPAASESRQSNTLPVCFSSTDAIQASRDGSLDDVPCEAHRAFRVGGVWRPPPRQSPHNSHPDTPRCAVAPAAAEAER